MSDRPRHTSLRRALHRGSDVIGVLDVGTAKTVCLIAERDEHGLPGRVLGAASQRSRGVKAGIVTDLDQAETVVRAIVHDAEAMAGVSLDAIGLVASCGRHASITFRCDAPLPERVVTEDDLARIDAAARAYAERRGHAVLHLNTLAHLVDGRIAADDLVGVSGRHLAADVHAVIADDAPLRNILHLVERCGAEPAGVVPAPHASALAVTTAAERDHGTIVVDIGAGSTSLAAYVAGHLVSTATFPIGGQHITWDIARLFGASTAEAERIKTLHGSLIRAPSDANDTISYTLLDEQGGDGTLHHETRARLVDIVVPRMTALFDLIAQHLAGIALPARHQRSIVFTGGASQLVGLADVAGELMGRPARIGRPLPSPALPSKLATPAFAAIVGAASALSEPSTTRQPPHLDVATGTNGRAATWIKESF
jgi:cell division protein FtsA